MRRRIIISLGLLLFLFIVGNAIAMWGLYRSIDELQALADSHRIQTMRSNLASSSIRIERDLLSDLAGHQRAEKERTDNIQRFRESLEQCGGCHHKPAVRERLDGIDRAFHDYWDVAGRFYAATDQTANADLIDTVQQRADRLARMTTEMADQAASHLAKKSDDVATSVHYSWLVLSITLVVALVFGGIVALHLERRLTMPVAALLKGIRHTPRGVSAPGFSFPADEEFHLLADAITQAYKDLEDAHDSVLQAEKLAAVGKLASGVAHEVSNPLASISSIAQMMRRRQESVDQAADIDLILEQVNRISRVIRDLLEFSRPTDRDGRQSVGIHGLLDQASTLMGYDKRADKIEILRDYSPDLPAVRGDPDRLLLVFTNIMINACDAMNSADEQRGTLFIQTRQRGRHAVVQFKDDGPGMNEDEITHAFEPFFTTKDPGVGTGLGLWICYQVIHRHGGTISIESAQGQGTTVTIELPCEGPTGPAPAEQEIATGDQPVNAPTAG